MKKPTCGTSSTMIYQHCLDREFLTTTVSHKFKGGAWRLTDVFIMGSWCNCCPLWIELHCINCTLANHQDCKVRFYSSAINLPKIVHHTIHDINLTRWYMILFLTSINTHFCIFPLPLHWPNSSQNCLVVWAKRLFILFGKRGLVNLFMEDTEIKTEHKKTCCTLKQQPIS
jgi:hypothetical protein